MQGDYTNCLDNNGAEFHICQAQAETSAAESIGTTCTRLPPELANCVMDELPLADEDDPPPWLTADGAVAPHFGIASTLMVSGKVERLWFRKGWMRKLRTHRVMCMLC